MIDLHSHILPGIDDGARDTADSLAMARAAAADGIRIVAATPHHNNGAYTNYAQDIRTLVNQLNKRLNEDNIPLTIVLGQEIRLNDLFWEDFSQGRLQGLNDSRYLLIEFPFTSVPRNVKEVFHELFVAGKVPIIAHPERNSEFMYNPDLLRELVEQGSLAQLTSDSLCGLYGRRIQKFALSLCKQNLVHIIASDAHDTSRRIFRMKEAYERIGKDLGDRYVNFFKENAAAIQLDRQILVPRAISKPRKRFLLW